MKKISTYDNSEFKDIFLNYDKKFENEYQLLSAIEQKNVSEVRRLLSLGVNVNYVYIIQHKTMTSERTALIEASRLNNTIICDMLLKAGAKINQKVNAGLTAAMYAASNGAISTFLLLISNNADLTIKTDYDKNVINYANQQIIFWLNKPESQDLILTKYPSLYNSLERMVILSPDIEKKFSYIKTATDLNLFESRKKVDKNTAYTLGIALVDAIERGYISNAHKLIDAGADVNIKTPEGLSPLVSAAHFGLLLLVKKLIKNGADINIQDIYGNTALYSSAAMNYTTIVNYLIKSGADMRINNNADKNFIDSVRGCHVTAKWLNHEKVQRMLLSKEPSLIKYFKKNSDLIKINKNIKNDFSHLDIADDLNLL